MDSRTPSGLHWTLGGVQLEYVGECKVLRKWCNPGPLDGSAPNLVKVAYDKNGQPYLQWAFNTQVCIMNFH